MASEACGRPLGMLGLPGSEVEAAVRLEPAAGHATALKPVMSCQDLPGTSAMLPSDTSTEECSCSRGLEYGQLIGSP